MAAKNCNMKGQKAILNCLGEDYTDEDKSNYQRVFHAIRKIVFEQS
jgi:hypothetical protein